MISPRETNQFNLGQNRDNADDIVIFMVALILNNEINVKSDPLQICSCGGLLSLAELWSSDLANSTAAVTRESPKTPSCQMQPRTVRSMPSSRRILDSPRATWATSAWWGTDLPLSSFSALRKVRPQT